jgi:hypothetical protein
VSKRLQAATRLSIDLHTNWVLPDGMDPEAASRLADEAVLSLVRALARAQAEADFEAMLARRPGTPDGDGGGAGVRLAKRSEQ